MTDEKNTDGSIHAYIEGGPTAAALYGTSDSIALTNTFNGRSAEGQISPVADGAAEPQATDLGSIQGTDGDAATPNLEGMPVTEIKPDDVGTLSLRYVNGVPHLVVSGGKAIPARLTVVDAAGTPVAAYTAGPVTTVDKTARFRVEIQGIQVGAFSNATIPDESPEPIEYREGTDPFTR